MLPHISSLPTFPNVSMQKGGAYLRDSMVHVTLSLLLWYTFSGNMPFRCIDVRAMIFAQTKTLMGEVMKEATFSLAEANFAAGDFR